MKIAILGFGVVGGGVAEVLEGNYELIKKSAGCDIEIKYIFDKRTFEGTKWESLVTTDFEKILSDPEVSLVCEMMGGVHPAYDFSLAALKAGKSVVTSNKAVVAEKGCELLSVARENGVVYLFEASVGGGIPIIHAMNGSLSGCEIYEINGILNGTTNYILTSMKESGVSYEEALKTAQSLGYAEADPTADVSGADTCRKICILAAIAWGKLYAFENVYCRGIDGISDAENALAASLGAAIKLVANARRENDKISVFVSPTAVFAQNPLYAVNDVFNAVSVNASALGDVLFYGRGAGRMPTASAVMSDIIDVASGNTPENGKWTDADKPDLEIEEVKGAYAVRASIDEESVRAIFGDVVCLKSGEYSDFVVLGISLEEINKKLGDNKVAVLRALL